MTQKQIYMKKWYERNNQELLQELLETLVTINELEDDGQDTHREEMHVKYILDDIYSNIGIVKDFYSEEEDA